MTILPSSGCGGAIARVKGAAQRARPLVSGLGLRSFAGNAAILSIGTIVAQIVTVAATPILTRIYSTEDFGIFAVFTAIVGTLAPVVCLRLDFALPLPAARRMSVALAELACLSTLLLSLLLGVAGIVIGDGWFGPLFGSIDSYLPLLWLALPPVALQLVLVGWNVRYGEYRALAYSRVATAICGLAGQLIGGFTSLGAMGLILGMAAGQWLGSTVQAKSLIRDFRRAGLVHSRLMRQAAYVYRKFLLWTMPSSVVNALGDQAVPIIVVALFGTEAGGLFFLASRVANLPLNLLGTSLSRVMWGEVSRMQRERPERLRGLFLTVTSGALLLGSPGLLLLPFGQQLFAFVFGEQWRNAGLLAAIVFFGAWMGVAANTSSSLSLLKHNHWQTAWEVTRLGMTASVTALAWALKFTLVQFSIVLSASMAISYFLLFLLNLIVITRISRGTSQAIGRAGA